MADIYNGYINQQALVKMAGFDGKYNPIAKTKELIDKYERAQEIRERQQFISRYRYKNTPKGIDTEILERILYYRGRVCLFKIDDTYYALPFALKGTIDVYGRYRAIVPLTFQGSVMVGKDGKEYMGDGTFLPDLTLKVLYDTDQVDGTQDCVIMDDYTNGISQYILPRYIVNEIYRKGLAEINILIRHNLISSARVYTIRVLDQGQKDAVLEEIGDMERAILEGGKRVFPITSSIKLEEVLNDKKLETQDYWECYVSLDNLRENMIGIENNGIFKKKERQLKGEVELEASSADLVYQDGLTQRKKALERFNALFNTNWQVEESEVISGYDKDMDEEISNYPQGEEQDD